MTCCEGLVDWFFGNLQPINIFVGAVALIISFVVRKGDEAHAIDCIAKGVTFCSLPSGLAFLWCAAFPTYVPKVADATLAFFVGGAALILIPFIDFRKLFPGTAKPS